MVEFLVYACAIAVVLLAIAVAVVSIRLAVCGQGIGDLHRRLRGVERTVAGEPWRNAKPAACESGLPPAAAEMRYGPAGVNVVPGYGPSVTVVPMRVLDPPEPSGLPKAAATPEDLRVGGDERELWRPWRDVGGG